MGKEIRKQLASVAPQTVIEIDLENEIVINSN